MEEHKVLWDGNTTNSEPPLRRPNRVAPDTANTVNNTNTPNLQDSIQSLDLSSSFNSSVSLDDDILSKSKLSVDAKEWFPPNYNKSDAPDTLGGSGKSVQNRLQKYKCQPEKPTNDSHMEGIPVASQNGVVFDETSKDVSKLQEIINELVQDPGLFDNVLGSFIETLGPYYDNVMVVPNIAELIVTQALLRPNFNYNAARLCSVIEEQCPMFRSALFSFCDRKVKENPYDCVLALFLAEIYVQFSYEQLYGQLLIQTLQRVLSLGDGCNVKSVCQALKLTGASLELSNKQAIDEIFKQLQITKDVQLAPIKNLIESVITLRSSNWGQGQSSPVTPINRYLNQESLVSNDDPIFYGPDGKELTDEERQFLSDNCLYQMDCPTDDSDSLIEPDPEMDEEMQIAFRQFLQLSK